MLTPKLKAKMMNALSILNPRHINKLFISIFLFSSISAPYASAGTAPSIPKTALYSAPPYTEQVGDKPSVALALSIEFPTVGAHYVSGIRFSTTDSTYSNALSYVGYFDTESCYRYIENPTETPKTGQTIDDYNRFIRSGKAFERMCNDAFSGNFLNWAGSSAIDMLRLALTGGDRYIDNPDLTILQRAILPSCSWTTATFPLKNLSKTGGSSGRAYFGAIPTSMQIAAGTNNVWVGNNSNMIYFGTSPVEICANESAYTLGKYYFRVQVCESSSGVLNSPRQYPFCKLYQSGYFKPIGAIQRYSDRLRISAFSYLLDNTMSSAGGRYGGALRAPMKYVGAKTFNEKGIENTPASGNPKAEWDESTGVFHRNPDGIPGFGISGVINYLNQFGRTGTGAPPPPFPSLNPGGYKRYDPVGELHYEALRYLQGLPPSPAAIAGITAEMFDGFPAYTTWTDPFGGTRSRTADYSCLKSNILVIGDVNTWDGGRLPAPSPPENIPDINAWRTIVQNFEKGLASTYIDGDGISRTTSNPNPVNLSVPGDTGQSQILGSAYWANTHDIRGTQWSNIEKQRPGLRVKTFTFDVNQYGKESDPWTQKNTNQFFMAAKYGGFKTSPSTTSDVSFNTWGNPFYRDDSTPDKYIWEDTNTSPERIGTANNYFLQKDGASVLTSLDEIFRRFSAKRRNIAGAAVQSRSLSTNENIIYLGLFDSEKWSGDVVALSIRANPAAPTSVILKNRPKWSAASELNQRTDPVNTRKIVIGNSGATANPTASDFTWLTIDEKLKTALSKATPGSPQDSLGEDRLNYIRGDRSKERRLFRVRSGILGDITNSGVVYSGAPTSKITDGGYAAFQSSMASRTAAVFAGSNDGMMHAFNAADGGELFAYIPSWIGPKLPALAQLDYDDNHQSFVDSTPEVAEARVGANWKTVLVSGTGNGGRGVFALDVSNPSAFDRTSVLWEFTPQDDPDIGNVIGKPRILKLRTSDPSSKSQTYKWYAVVASGVNNHIPDSSGIYGSGYPALFILDLGKAVGTGWTKGENYHKISIPTNGNLDYLSTYTMTAGTALSASKATGLVNFSFALGGAREVEYIYMGDLHGNLWKLDFTRVGSTKWNINELSPYKNSSLAPYPLYIARDAADTIQPITAPPMIANGPTPGTHYVVFGTGSYLEDADQFSVKQQSIYMVYDNGDPTADVVSSSPGSVISGRSRLKRGSILNGTVSMPSFTLGRASRDVNSEAIRSGWYFDLASAGERQISGITFSGDKASFSTLIPITADTETVQCVPDNGGGNTYDVSIAAGSGFFQASTVGLMGPPVHFDLVDGITFSEPGGKAGNTGRRTRVIPTAKIQIGTLGSALIPGPERTETAGRLNWRKINNFLDMKQRQ